MLQRILGYIVGRCMGVMWDRIKIFQLVSVSTGIKNSFQILRVLLEPKN